MLSSDGHQFKNLYVYEVVLTSPLQDHSASAEAHMPPLASKPGTNRAMHKRAAALEPSILEHASAMAHAVLTHLQQQLESLPEAGIDVAGAGTVEQALLIGELPSC